MARNASIVAPERMRRVLRRIRDRVRGWYYRRGDQLTVQYRGEGLRFDTRSEIAKDWFFPRYGGGRRLHEPRVCRVLEALLEPGDVFFDVGANVGFFTVLGARLCAPGGTVHAFELDPRLIGEIARSVCLNRGLAHVRTICCACGDGNGDLVAYAPSQWGNPSTNRIVPLASQSQHAADASGTAVTLTLDRYCDRSGVRPDLVKMDIEGGEVEALRGMRRVLTEARPRLVLELHPEAVRERGVDPENLAEAVRGAGYGIRVVPSYRQQHPERSLNDITSPFDEGLLASSDPVMLLFQPD